MYAYQNIGSDYDLGATNPQKQIRNLQKRIANLQKQIAREQHQLTQAQAKNQASKVSKLQAEIDQKGVLLTDLQTQLANLQAGIQTPVTSTITTPDQSTNQTVITPATPAAVVPTVSWMTAPPPSDQTATVQVAPSPAPAVAVPADLLSNPWVLIGGGIILLWLIIK